jgi:hypothetical protein
MKYWKLLACGVMQLSPHVQSSFTATTLEDIESFSIDNVCELLKEWKLLGTFEESFRAQNISGELLLEMNPSSINEDTFGSRTVQKAHWNLLYKKINNLKNTLMISSDANVATASSNARRLSTLSQVLDGAGVFVKNNASAFVLGSGGDIVLRRAGHKLLSIDNDVVVAGLLLIDNDVLVSGDITLSLNGANASVSTIAQKSSHTACQSAWTGEYCNETCTDTAYYVMSSCLYDIAQEYDAENTNHAAGRTGFYRPTNQVAVVECCFSTPNSSSTTCTRKDSDNNCLAGTGSYDEVNDADNYEDFLIDYHTAFDACESIDMRLCTADEVFSLDLGCCTAGCGYDNLPIWTSTMQYNCNGEFAY